MRFKQVSGLLQGVADARLALAQAYERLATQVDSTRTRMVLDYLASRERQGYASLTRYLQQAPAAVLNTWFQGDFDSDFIQRVGHLDASSQATPAEMLTLALSLDNELVALLAQQAAQAPTPESRDALLSVMADEQTNQRKMVLNVARFEDV